MKKLPGDLLILEYRYTRYRIPYKRPVVTAHGVFPYREGAIVELVSDEDYVGVGEIAPLPDFGFSLDDALARIQRVQQAFGVELMPLLTLLTQTSADMFGIGDMPSIGFGLEAAAFDLYGKLKQHPISQCFELSFNEAKAAVPVNAVVTAASDELAVEDAKRAVANGFGCIKLKVGISDSVDAEVARIEAIRAAIGPAIHLRIDANEAWSFDQALAILKRVADLDIQYCEQPLHRDNVESMHDLRLATPVCIAADEAATTMDSRVRTVRAEAADIVVIKPQSFGSLWGARDAIGYWATKSIPSVASVITSSMESGIGVTASLHLAAAISEITLECGLATLDLLEDDLVVSAPQIENGSMLVPSGHGLGVELDRAALEKYAV